MIATTHMLVGAVAAARARSTPGAVGIGVLTHLLLDAIPHRDYRRSALRGLALPADLITGAVAVWGLSRGSTRALAGAFGGELPDALRVAEQAVRLNVTSWAHDASHSDKRPRPWGSALVQGLVALTAGVMLAADHGAPGTPSTEMS